MTSPQRRFRIDPRLLIGSFLVLASVLGVIWVVSSAKQTVSIYAAAAPIAQGDGLAVEQLAVVEVPVSATNSLYLTTDAVPEGAVITTRPIGAGELIPMSALGVADDTSASVVVTIGGALPEDVSTGTAVELWSAAPGERPGTYGTPVVLVQQAHVVRVLESEQLVHSGQVEVELRIPDSELAEVLTATTNGAQLQIIPVYQSVGE
ncbi:MAG: hypothetical protein ACTHXA_13600 [Gulosibacter sp.]|uniref:hypothetical protein n=1 Tax=Gulosibacter sp. TaxID=2817531 RepID=UPI003F8DF8E4